MVKQRNDSCDAYKKAGRSELLENEKKKLKLLMSFLPKQLKRRRNKKICEETNKVSWR